MKHGRLPWLLAALALLLFARVAFPPGAHAPVTVSEAVLRRVAPVSTRAAATPLADVVTEKTRKATSVDVAQQDEESAGNAFAVRPPPAPPYFPPPPPAPKVAKTLPVVSPPAPTVTQVEQPLAVPFQVIGTWDDGQGLGVFLSSPNGTLLARQGTVIRSEYRVTAVTADQVSMVHLASKRDVRLPVPVPRNIPQQPALP